MRLFAQKATLLAKLEASGSRGGVTVGMIDCQLRLGNRIRGMMKTFGLIVPAGKGSTFEANVRARLGDDADLASILLPLLQVWRSMRLRAAELGRQLVADARKSESCRLLMSILGVGVVKATSFATAIEDPGNFRKFRSVGALARPRNQTLSIPRGREVDYDGHISRRGDTHVHSLLYEAATVILTVSVAWRPRVRRRGRAARSLDASSRA